MPPKKYKPLKKSKSNTSGKPSAAKQEAMDRNSKKKRKKTKIAKPKNYSVKLSALNPQSPKQLPETPLSKKGMTMRQLLKSTPRLFINNSQDVIIQEFKQTKTKSGMPAISAKVFTSDPFRPMKLKRVHQVHIIGLDKDAEGNPDLKTPINRHKKILVSCPCENFVLSGGEYACAARGCARIVYGNGNPPVVTNPHLIPFACKHIVNVSHEMIRRDI